LTIPSLSYITNYDLVIEKTNTVCDDSDPIANHQLADFDIIKMVPTMYSKSSAKNHVEILKYIMYDNPPFINKFTEKTQILYKDLDNLIANAKDDNEKARQFVKEYVDEINGRNGTRTTEETERLDKESKDTKELQDGEKENKTAQTTVTGPSTTTKTTVDNKTPATNNNVKEAEEKNKKDTKEVVAEKKKTEADLLEEEEKFRKEFKEKIEEGFKNMKEIKEKVSLTF
jgi:hypothetical protein